MSKFKALVKTARLLRNMSKKSDPVDLVIDGWTEKTFLYVKGKAYLLPDNILDQLKDELPDVGLDLMEELL